MVDLGALEITPVVWYGIASLLPAGSNGNTIPYCGRNFQYSQIDH